jgi:hypothetical protein
MICKNIFEHACVSRVGGLERLDLRIDRQERGESLESRQPEKHEK